MGKICLVCKYSRVVVCAPSGEGGAPRMSCTQLTVQNREGITEITWLALDPSAGQLECFSRPIRHCIQTGIELYVSITRLSFRNPTSRLGRVGLRINTHCTATIGRIADSARSDTLTDGVRMKPTLYCRRMFRPLECASTPRTLIRVFSPL